MTSLHSFKFSSFWSLLVLISLTIRETREQECSQFASHFSGLFGLRCCDGEPLNYRLLLGATSVCSTSGPNDPTMALPTSYWLHFECLMRKVLESYQLPFSLTKFSLVMISTLSQEKRNDIYNMVIAENPNDILIPPGKSQDEILQIVQQMWNKYFEAEYRVCNNVSKEKYDSNVAKRWIPVHQCGTESYPDITLLVALKQEVQTCKMQIQQRNFDISSFSRMDDYSLMGTCRVIASNLLQIDDLNTKIDYKSLTDKIMPNFWSTSTIQRAKGFLIKSMPRELQIETSDKYEDIFEKMMTNAQHRLETLGAHSNETSDDFYLNVFMVQDLIEGISKTRLYVTTY